MQQSKKSGCSCILPCQSVRHKVPEKEFKEAHEGHKNSHSVEMAEKCKSGLVEIVEISGYHLKKDAIESGPDTIEEIVKDLAPETSSKVIHLEEYLCEIDFVVEEVYQKLSMDANDVRVIGIYGMPGIGKTTIAKVLFNKYSNQFDIENVKQYSHGEGGTPLLTLLEHLLSGILKRKDYQVPYAESRLGQLKQILCLRKLLLFWMIWMNQAIRNCY